MTRQEAYQTLTLYTKSQNLIMHHLAVEAVMRSLAMWVSKHTGTQTDVDTWGLVGLLHDADYEITRNTPEKHTLFLEEKLGKTLAPEVLYAIKAHNFAYTKLQPKSLMDWSLYTCDELTGFIVTSASNEKNKKLAFVTVASVLEKINDKKFAKEVDRNKILLCEKTLGIPLRDFVEIVLKSMQAIAPALGFG